MSLCTNQFTIKLSGSGKFLVVKKGTTEPLAAVLDIDDAILKMLELQKDYDNDLKNSVPAVFME